VSVKSLIVISDVHSNLEALDAVLREAGEEDVYCLGDIVGYGANPNEVVGRLREIGAKSVMGNHDHAAVTGEIGDFNARAAMAALWTRGRLTPQNSEYLRGLPLVLRDEIEGAQLFFTHGSPDDNLREYVDPRTHADLFSRYLAQTGARVVALGHTHIPYVWEEGDGVVFNPGSVGQPRDGDPRASYAVLSIEGSRVRVGHHRLAYDVSAARRKIIEAGLPRQLGDRLALGL
jgi:putative phosphoesterase